MTGAKRGSRRIASAVDRELLAALRAIFDRPSRAKLVSVQPYLMSAFNRWRASLDRGGWLMLPERGRVCLAMTTAESWGAVQSVRSAEDSWQEWLALLDREAQRAAQQPVPSTVLARSTSALDDAAASESWQLVRLEPPHVDGIPDADRELYAMALHAA